MGTNSLIYTFPTCGELGLIRWHTHSIFPPCIENCLWQALGKINFPPGCLLHSILSGLRELIMWRHLILWGLCHLKVFLNLLWILNSDCSLPVWYATLLYIYWHGKAAKLRTLCWRVQFVCARDPLCRLSFVIYPVRWIAWLEQQQLKTNSLS